MVFSILLAAAWTIVCLARSSVVEFIGYSLTDRLGASPVTAGDSGAVIVVEIDERALAARGQWPWPRYRLAALLDEISRMGAASIALDFVLAEPDRTSVAEVQQALARERDIRVGVSGPAGEELDNDAVLARSLSRGPFVLGYEFLFGDAAHQGAACEPHAVHVLIQKPAGGQGRLPFDRAEGGICSLVQLTRAVTLSGFMNGHADSDGKLRRLPLLLRFKGALHPNLALAALMKASGVRTLALDGSDPAQSYLRFTGHAIPVDAAGDTWIRFPADRSVVPHLSAEDVMTGRVPRAEVEGRIVFVGVRASGLFQSFRTPSRAPFSAAEIHAQLADTILSRSYLRRPAWIPVLEVAAALGLAVLVGIGVAKLSLGFILLGATLGLAGLWAGAGVLARGQGLLVSPLLPGAVIVLNGAVLLVFTYWYRQRRSSESLAEALALARESQRELTSILNTIPDVVYRLDAAGSITFVSPAVTRYGREPAGLIGTPLLDLVVPDDRAAAKHRIDEHRTGARATVDLEIRLLLAQGGAGWGHFSVSAEGIYADADGGRALVGTQGIARDIDLRRRLEAQLASSRQLETIGSLAAGVAHDLNNILGALVGYPELLLFDLPHDSPLRPGLEAIQQSGQRAAAIVQDMLAIARRGARASEILNLNDVVSSYMAAPEFTRLKELHPQVHFVAELSPALMNIAGSPPHLSKVIMNLVGNAVEAMPAGGTIRVVTENRYLDEELQAFERILEGEYVQLSIIDQGVGIAAENLVRIFEPFYSTKRLGRSGTGLGMAVVWGTVKDHRGFLDLRSREGEGTRFDLYFPVTRQDVDRQGRPTALEDYVGSERILVVDDVPEQQTIAVHMLGRLGYQVSAVSSGEEAVEYLRSHRVDLVVLDMIMPPGIDGLETYRRIREVNAGQKAIIASGYAESERVNAAQAIGAGAYVRKPYTLETIGTAVRRELDRKPEPAAAAPRS